MIKWYSEILHTLKADPLNLLAQHEIRSSGLQPPLPCCTTCTSGACPEATSRVPCLRSKSVIGAASRRCHQPSIFHQQPSPCPVVPSCVSTREFQTLGFQEFVRLLGDARNLAYAIRMLCSPFLWSLRSVWEFQTREDVWSEVTWAHTGISHAFNWIIVGTKKIQQPVLDHGKLLNSDMNSLCPLICKATSRKKLYKRPFLVSIYSHAAAGESWHAFTDIMPVYTSWD